MSPRTSRPPMPRPASRRRCSSAWCSHAGLLTEMSGFAPLLLLDEVVAHLDPGRRAALYAELETLGAQAWLTGADPAAFSEIEAIADVLEVNPGQIRKRK